MLRTWRKKVEQTTAIRRKCWIVPRAGLAALGHEPEGLDKWVIDPSQLSDLPADICGNDVLIVDDGYDRQKLPIPGILHMEVGIRWTAERPSPMPETPQAEAAGNVTPRPLPSTPPLPLPPPPSTPTDRALLGTPIHTGQLGAGASPKEGPAFQDIINNTLAAIRHNRWVSQDRSSPNTVEFWLRIFTVHMIRKNGPVTEAENAYLKFLTKELYTSDSYGVLDKLYPHFEKLASHHESLLPPLLRAMVDLARVPLFDGSSKEDAEDPRWRERWVGGWPGVWAVGRAGGRAGSWLGGWPGRWVGGGKRWVGWKNGGHPRRAGRRGRGPGVPPRRPSTPACRSG